jgi:hypothetical protein
MTKHPQYSSDEQDFEDDVSDHSGAEAGFERIRRTTEKTPSIKGDRRQQGKEWGKAVNKYHKQRKRIEGPGKP